MSFKTHRSNFQSLKFYFSRFLRVIFVFLLLVQPACFFGGLKNGGKIKKYIPGRVLIQKGFYQVGPLAADWKRIKIDNYSALTFRSEAKNSVIQTAAYCDEAYEDAALKTLTTHLHFLLTPKKTILEKKLTLSGREALRTVVSGNVDGILSIIDSVVVKKNECLFDFVLVALPADYEAVKADFEAFFNGFEYQ